MRITISGTAASGKSTVSQLLAKKLGYKYHSMGELQRALAREHNIDITKWNLYEAKHDEFDKNIDERQKEIGDKENNFVIDSWLGPKFIPNSFRVFLYADIEVRIQRRLAHKREEEHFDDAEKAKIDMIQRQEINRQRWIKMYEYDFMDWANYDLVIDTSNITPEDIVKQIIKSIESKST